jgi:hypothetical protein
VQLTSEVAQQWSPFIGERRRETRRRIQGLRDAQELLGLQAPATSRTLDPRSDIVRSADPDAGALAEQRPGLVRLVELTRDDQGVRRWLERLGEPL